MMKNPLKKRPAYVRILSLLANALFWKAFWKRLLQFFLPAFFPSLRLFQPLPQAKLVQLDGKTATSLSEYAAMSHDMPVIINIGSYN